MRSLIPRYLFIHFCSSSRLSRPRVSLLFLHSVAGDGAPLRRPQPHPLCSSPASSSQSFTYSSSSSRRHYDEEGKNVKVTVWWDFENCNIPGTVNAFRVVHRIMLALRSSGIKGPVTITAFGDLMQLSRTTQEALTSTGVCLSHVPHCGKNSSDRFFIADLVYWVSQNPPPVHFFLISGDSDFANILHRLRMNNYNILLASKEDAPGVLCSAATIMWQWYDLVKGEYNNVKYFNHPPDALYSSWYGHQKGVLDNPFSDMEQATNSQSEESLELNSETTFHPIPKVLVSAIRGILYSYPEGMNLGMLRSELKRNNITIDKDFFGYKKFSHLLASMPNVVKLVPHPSAEGQVLVVCRPRRTADSAPLRFKPVQDIDVSDGEKSHTSTENGKPLSVTPTRELDPASTISESPANQKDIESDSDKQNSIHTQGQDAVDKGGRFERIKNNFSCFQHKAEPSFSCKGNDVEANANVSTSEQIKNIAAKRGFVQRIWRTWSGTSAGQSFGGTDSICGFDSTSHEESGEVKSICMPTEKLKLEDEVVQSKHNFSNQLSTSSSSMEASDSLAKDKTIRQSEIPSGSSDMKQTLFSRIASWCMFWKSDKVQEVCSAPQKELTNDKANVAPGRSDNDLSNIINGIKPHDVFSKGYFWDALGSFFLTSKGSDLVLKSRTRGQLVHELQKEGPWVLKDLTEAQLFELVSLVIVEKKWLEESPSQRFPFKLSLAAKGKHAPSPVHSSNGLSSLFTSTISKSNTHRQHEQETLDQNFGVVRGSFNETLDAKQPQSFLELKSWFQKAYKGVEDVDPDDLQKLFKSKFNTRLVSNMYGYVNLQRLIAACLTDTDDCHGKRKLPPSREEILSDCHKLLIEFFDEYPEGFNMSLFKPTFMQRYGYALDFQRLGYSKLAALLQIMPGVRVESSFIIPAERFSSDSSRSKQSIIGTIDYSSQDGEGNAPNKDSEGEINSEDFAWDELGPVSKSVSHEDSTDAQVKDKEVGYDEASLSDEDFSDSEGDSPSQSDELQGKSKRCGDDSSLIQILDSWYGSKDGGEREQAQGGKAVVEKEPQTLSVDGLVDCSKNNTDIPLVLKFVDKQKLKVRLPKRYSFVSESQNHDKEKLVESILGSLKKAGDSKLHS